MVSKEEFEVFKKSLVSSEEKVLLDQSVKKARLVRYILLSIEVLIAVIFLAIDLPKKRVSVSTFMIPFFCFISFILTFAITKIYERKQLNKIKQQTLPKIIEFLLGEQLDFFSMDRCLPEDDFKNSGFSGSYDDFDGEDFISIDIPKDNGKKSGVLFKACDLYITREEKDSEGNTRDVTVYSGAFCAVHFPFEFKCRLAINSSIRGVKKFKLEDVSFNKTFQVFSDNKVEALCILTPTMMQKLMRLYEKTRNVKITVFDNHLYLGFPCVDLFEFGSLKNGFSESAFDDIYDDVTLLLAIVDEIKNNNKVFKI